MQEFTGTSLIGRVSNITGAIDKDLLEELEQLMIKHGVNYIEVGWARFDFLGDRFKEEPALKFPPDGT